MMKISNFSGHGSGRLGKDRLHMRTLTSIAMIPLMTLFSLPVCGPAEGVADLDKLAASRLMRRAASVNITRTD